jgi:hypothetical protein
MRRWLVLVAVMVLGVARVVAADDTEVLLYLPFVERPSSLAIPPTMTPTQAPVTLTPAPIVVPEPTRDPATCDPSYPTVCIPPPPPDLNCSDISHRRFPVIGNDPHRFDSDGDGIGCER